MLAIYQTNHGTTREDLPIELNLKKENLNESSYALHHHSR